MQWQALGFTSDPLSTDPISEQTLALYTGHEQELQTCFNVLSNKNVRIVIEGARGVGTTSFANVLRFNLQHQKQFFTPTNEIRVEAGWQLETLLAVIIANLIREIELFEADDLIKDPRFLEAKALSNRIAETYRSFGLGAFGMSGNYGKNAGIVTQPVLVPSPVLGHRLEDLVSLIKSYGYEKGILVQLNNLDLGEVHQEPDLKQLFNSLRDYAQTDGISWLLVGDTGLRKFIAQQVDRLDDIISYEVNIAPLTEENFQSLIEKRINYYRMNPKARLPIERDVFSYLFDITKGRLRYIFGLLSRLIATLSLGDLTDKITLSIAKETLIDLSRSRIKRNDITQSEESILRMAVSMKKCTVGSMAKELKKSGQYVGKILSKLAQAKLLHLQREGNSKCYLPSLDAMIAYSDSN